MFEFLCHWQTSSGALVRTWQKLSQLKAIDLYWNYIKSRWNIMMEKQFHFEEEPYFLDLSDGDAIGIDDEEDESSIWGSANDLKFNKHAHHGQPLEPMYSLDEDDKKYMSARELQTFKAKITRTKKRPLSVSKLSKPNKPTKPTKPTKATKSHESESMTVNSNSVCESRLFDDHLDGGENPDENPDEDDDDDEDEDQDQDQDQDQDGDEDQDGDRDTVGKMMVVGTNHNRHHVPDKSSSRHVKTRLRRKETAHPLEWDPIFESSSVTPTPHYKIKLFPHD
jgi:hypothetical protein